MHSALPRCRYSFLSTNQSEHDSRTFPSLFAIWSGSLCENRIVLSYAYKRSLQSGSMLITMLLRFRSFRPGHFGLILRWVVSVYLGGLFRPNIP